MSLFEPLTISILVNYFFLTFTNFQRTGPGTKCHLPLKACLVYYSYALTATVMTLPIPANYRRVSRIDSCVEACIIIFLSRIKSAMTNHFVSSLNVYRRFFADSKWTKIKLLQHACFLCLLSARAFVKRTISLI